MPKGIPKSGVNKGWFSKGHKINNGRPSHWNGKKREPLSDEWKSNISKGGLGRIVSQETRDKIRKAHLGMKPTEETREKLVKSHLGQIPGNKGKKTPRSIVEKMRRTKLGDKLYEERKRLGLLDKRRVWNEFYSSDFVENRKMVYRRDGWRCQICDYKCDRTVKGFIQCHHIDYDINNNQLSNLITLCRSCHMKTNSNRKHWRELLSKKELSNAQVGVQTSNGLDYDLLNSGKPNSKDMAILSEILNGDKLRGIKKTCRDYNTSIHNMDEGIVQTTNL